MISRILRILGYPGVFLSCDIQEFMCPRISRSLLVLWYPGVYLSYDILESWESPNRPSQFPFNPLIIFSMFLISLGTGSEVSISDLTVIGLLWEGGDVSIGGVTLCGGETGGLAGNWRDKDLKAEVKLGWEVESKECEVGLRLETEGG